MVNGRIHERTKKQGKCIGNGPSHPEWQMKLSACEESEISAGEGTEAFRDGASDETQANDIECCQDQPGCISLSVLH